MDERIPLNLAAKELGVSRDVAMRLLLVGRLTGEQIAGRFWMITRESVEEERARRAAAEGEPVIATA